MFGPHFADEIRAAGLGDGVGWDEEGNLHLSDHLDEAVKQAVRDLAAAHDPVPPEGWGEVQEEKAALDDLANNKTLGAAVEVFVDILGASGIAITLEGFAAQYVAKRKAKVA